MKEDLRRTEPSYMKDIANWVHTLNYPEVVNQIILYKGHIKNYSDAYANLIAFLALILAILQLLFKNETVTAANIITLTSISTLIVIIPIIKTMSKRGTHIKYLLPLIPLFVGALSFIQTKELLNLLSFIMIALYFWAFDYYKEEDMKHHITLELLEQRKIRLESCNSAHKIRIPSKYK